MRTGHTRILKRGKSYLPFLAFLLLLILLPLGRLSAQTCNARFSFAANGKFVALSNQSTTSGGANKNMAIWNFGDGIVDTVPFGYYYYHYHHLYKKEGKYRICLTVRDSAGSCSSTSCDSINVHVECNAHFNQRFVNEGHTVQFFNLSSSYSLIPVSYLWEFGDGDTSHGASPIHRYAATGTYKVCLTRTDTTNNCTTTECDSVVITNGSCIARYSYYCDSTGKVEFTNSTQSTDSIISYTWYFGDSTTSNQKNPVHKYTYAGYYMVNLYVKSAGGIYSGYGDYIKVNGRVAPHALFDAYPNGRKVNFVNESTGENLSYLWEFGDGDTSTSKDVTHIYADQNQHTACLTITDNVYHNSSKFCQNIGTSSGTCKADFQYTRKGLTFYFQNTSSTSSGSLESSSFSWDFGDSASSTERYGTSHTYARQDTFTVTLSMYSYNTGCRDVISKKIIIPRPVCAAGIKYRMDKNMVYLEDTTYDDEYIYKRVWKYGDGDSAVFHIDHKDTIADRDNFVTHIYKKSSDSFQVCLTNYDSVNHCATTDCVWVKPSPLCKAYFNLPTDVKSMFIRYQDNSSYGYGLTNEKIYWDFGDGTSSSAFYGVHTYAKKGTYNICMTIQDSNGLCKSQYCQKVNILGYSLAGAAAYLHTDSSGYPKLGSMSAMGYLIQFNDSDSSIVAIDSAKAYAVDTNLAFFRFSGITSSHVYLKAALLPSDSLYSKYMPTYFQKALKWKNAFVFSFTPYSSYDSVIIFMHKGNNTGGPGFVGGKVSMGANKKEGDAMSYAQVMLVDENDEPIAYTYSDKNGNFSISNIPYGTYKVYAEIPGLIPVEDEVTLTQSHPTEQNVTITVKERQVITSIRKPLERNYNSLRIYPNPTDGPLYITIPTEGKLSGQLSITNTLGQEVVHMQVQLQQGETLSIPETAALPKGVYMIKLENNQKIYTSTFFRN